MKRKFLTLVLAICCVVPCVFMLAGCNEHEHEYNANWTFDDQYHWHECVKCDEKQDFEAHDWDNGVITVEPTKTAEGTKLFVCNDCKTTKTESVPYVPETTVTETEWTQALGFYTLNKFKFTQEVGVRKQVIIRDGDVVYQSVDPAETINEYQSKEGDLYYAYNNDTGNWVKTEMEESDYNMTLLALDMTSLEFNSFSYNTTLKAYEAETMFTFKDAKLYFEDGKLVKLTALYNDIFPVTYLVEYDNISLTLPVIE